MCVSHKLLGKLFPMSGRRQRHSWGRCRGHSSPYLRGHLKDSPRKQTPCYHMPQKHHLGDWKCPSQGWVNFQHQMGVGGASEDKDEMGVGASEAWDWPFRRGIASWQALQRLAIGEYIIPGPRLFCWPYDLGQLLLLFEWQLYMWNKGNRNPLRFILLVDHSKTCPDGGQARSPAF